MGSNNLNLESKLAQGKLAFGSWITIGNEGVAEMMAQQGFVRLVVDMERSGRS